MVASLGSRQSRGISPVLTTRTVGSGDGLSERRAEHAAVHGPIHGTACEDTGVGVIPPSDGRRPRASKGIASLVAGPWPASRLRQCLGGAWAPMACRASVCMARTPPSHHLDDRRDGRHDATIMSATEASGSPVARGQPSPDGTGPEQSTPRGAA